MIHFIEFPFDEGGRIIVEVKESEEEVGTHRVARGSEENPEKALHTFEQAVSQIRPATEKIMTTLRSLAQKPDEIEMEFGVSFHAQMGAIIASASTDANYKVTLHWKGETQEGSH